MSSNALSYVWHHPAYESADMRLLMYEVAWGCGSGEDGYGGIEHRTSIDPAELARDTGIAEERVRELLNIAVERGWLVRDEHFKPKDGFDLPWRFFPPHERGTF